MEKSKGKPAKVKKGNVDPGPQQPSIRCPTFVQWMLKVDALAQKDGWVPAPGRTIFDLAPWKEMWAVGKSPAQAWKEGT